MVHWKPTWQWANLDYDEEILKAMINKDFTYRCFLDPPDYIIIIFMVLDIFGKEDMFKQNDWHQYQHIASFLLINPLMQ